MLLSCAREALPGAGAAFMIATVDATVSAVSEAAEPLFGPEQAILGAPVARPVGQPDGRGPAAAHRHPGRDARPRAGGHARARPAANAAGLGTMAARISTCGRPRAALITVEPSGFAGVADSAQIPCKNPCTVCTNGPNRHKPLKCCAALAEKLCSGHGARNAPASM